MVPFVCLATHRTVRPRRPVATLRTIAALRTIGSIDADHPVVIAPPAMVGPVVAPPMIAVAIPLDFLDLWISSRDFLRRRQPDVRSRHPRNGQQGRYESELLHDSCPPYRLTR